MGACAKVEQTIQHFDTRRVRFPRAEIGQIRTKARRAELRPRLMDIVTGDTLAISPPSRLITAEIGTPHLLRMASRATKICIHLLPTCRDPRRSRRIRLP